MSSIHLKPVETAEANADQQRLFDRAVKEFQMVPNLFKSMAHQPALLEMYMNGYNAFRTQTNFNPAEQETILLTVSSENECSYCIHGHSMMAEMFFQMPADLVRAIRNRKDIPDPKLAALSSFTLEMMHSKGNPSKAAVDQFVAAGFQESDIMNVLLGITIKTISNFTNHLFNTELDEMSKAYRLS